MSYRIKNCNYRQRGAALITALVMLTIMTLLAISSMSTNTLEEKMASNAQQVERAFHTAETGLQMVLADNNAFDTNNNVNNNNTPFNMSDDVYDYGANADGQRDTIGEEAVVGYTGSGIAYRTRTTYRANFRQKTPPKRSADGWNAEIYSCDHFDLAATGDIRTPFPADDPIGISTTLHAGAYQVGPK